MCFRAFLSINIDYRTDFRGYETYFVLNWTGHENLIPRKNLNTEKYISLN